MAGDPTLAVSAALPFPKDALATILDQAATVVARAFFVWGEEGGRGAAPGNWPWAPPRRARVGQAGRPANPNYRWQLAHEPVALCARQWMALTAPHPPPAAAFSEDQ